MNDAHAYSAVINDEEQYSIWPAHLDLPEGWRKAGTEGTKAECLAFVEEVWTDMRPATLRASMDRTAEGTR
ncbi:MULTISPECIES: MbtH family NRPS accessory protein [unclassified Streptomyces]|uniref:MbtH family protein n=1 Tax=unclassified Streptomyces TaxID=2593676 RepID=UPI0011E7BE8B|nr:MbtH family NRPS accessory protein [Streptomyces sp. sk2.1]TXS61450.1 antibiotic synthesis protein MbtH [Streptomyces sp. sk2.1]